MASGGQGALSAIVPTSLVFCPFILEEGEGIKHRQANCQVLKNLTKALLGQFQSTDKQDCGGLFIPVANNTSL